MHFSRRVRTFLGSSAAALTLVLGAQPAAAVEPAPATFEGLVDGPNYHWRNDPEAQIMAQHLGPVLHRVPGSWFNAPDIPGESRDVQATGKALFGPSTPIFVGSNKMCTLAVAGYDQHGNKVGITAGHCGNPGDEVFSADAPQVGAAGNIVQVSPELDYALVQFNDRAELTRSYSGVTINAVGGQAALGQQLCKKGVATGYTCGIAWDAYNAQVCAMQGDSGAPMFMGDRLIGVISGGNPVVPAGTCSTPWQGPLHMPTVSSSIDAILADLDAQGGVGAGFQLA
ncbi:S1 family peptidase [Corynebacterium sp. H128]|uniref:S1 family peptidase n=1 Tax=unclassified Corynebacterium TaxID=2624378 RepID=UPI0030ADC28F